MATDPAGSGESLGARPGPRPLSPTRRTHSRAGLLRYGVSEMQGWRMHMEVSASRVQAVSRERAPACLLTRFLQDAHITKPELSKSSGVGALSLPCIPRLCRCVC